MTGNGWADSNYARKLRKINDDTTQDQDKKLKINYELMKRWSFFLEPQGQNVFFLKCRYKI